MQFFAIFCKNYNNAIGWKSTNDVVFYIKEDMDLFKKITTSSLNDKKNIIVMGRNTWRSLSKKPLPGRMNCVISSKFEKLNLKYGNHKNFKAFQNLESFLTFTHNNVDLYNNVYVIGGVSIYELFFYNDLISTIYCTSIITPNDKGDIILTNVPFEKFEISSIYKYKNIKAIDTISNDEVILDFNFCTYYHK